MAFWNKNEKHNFTADQSAPKDADKSRNLLPSVSRLLERSTPEQILKYRNASIDEKIEMDLLLFMAQELHTTDGGWWTDDDKIQLIGRDNIDDWKKIRRIELENSIDVSKDTKATR